MSDVVQTGGLKSFGANAGVVIDPERRSDIRQAYAAADDRKRRERRNRIILGVVIALILVGLGVWYLL